MISLSILFSLDNLSVTSLSLIGLISSLLTKINSTNTKISNTPRVLLYLRVRLRYYHVYSLPRRQHQAYQVRRYRSLLIYHLVKTKNFKDATIEAIKVGKIAIKSSHSRTTTIIIVGRPQLIKKNIIRQNSILLSKLSHPRSLKLIKTHIPRNKVLTRTSRLSKMEALTTISNLCRLSLRKPSPTSLTSRLIIAIVILALSSNQSFIST